MKEVIFLFVLALVWVIAATVQDIKTREVANWLNFSLIIFALGFRFFYSLFVQSNLMFFYQGLIGLGIFFVLGNLFYYGRIFAGGDAKLLIALGPILPFSNSLFTNLKVFAMFFFILLFVGAVYGLVWSTILTVKNFQKFKKEFFRRFKKARIHIYIFMFFGLLVMLLGFLQQLFLFVGILIFVLPYFYFYAKTIDEVCMIKKIQTQFLREGDWLYRDVKLGRGIIRAKWDGLNRKQIKQIQKKYKIIRIKQGIPFVPVFLVSFVALFVFYFLRYPFW